MTDKHDFSDGLASSREECAGQLRAILAAHKEGAK